MFFENGGSVNVKDMGRISAVCQAEGAGGGNRERRDIRLTGVVAGGKQVSRR
jgi:hypothetical protein